MQRQASAHVNLDAMVDAPQSGSADSAAAWHFSEVADKAAISGLAMRARAAFSFRHYNQDIEWQSLGMGPRDKMVALIDAREGGLQGFMSVHARDASIKHRIGSLTVFRKRMRRFDVYEGPATRRPGARDAIAAGLIALGERLPRNGSIYLEAVPLNSDLHAVLESPGSKIRQTFHVLPWGKTSVGRITWSASVDEYLKTIGKGSRRDLKRNSSALMSDAAMRCEVKRFEAPADIDTFLRDGISISNKTYQKKLLDRGLSVGGKVEAQIRFAAEKKGFVGHILYIDDVPAAFQYGLVYNKTCFVEQVGYDPAWATRQVGAVLFFESLRDLEAAKTDIKIFDFGQGMTLFKERTTNEQQAVIHYYLFNRTMTGFATYHSAKAVAGAANLLHLTLEKLQVRNKIKAVLRRWTGHGHMR
jgi:hypothetical protein